MLNNRAQYIALHIGKVACKEDKDVAANSGTATQHKIVHDSMTLVRGVDKTLATSSACIHRTHNLPPKYYPRAYLCLGTLLTLPVGLSRS